MAESFQISDSVNSHGEDVKIVKNNKNEILGVVVRVISKFKYNKDIIQYPVIWHNTTHGASFYHIMGEYAVSWVEGIERIKFQYLNVKKYGWT